MTSHGFLIDQNRFLPDLSSTFSQFLITWFLIVVGQEVSNLDSSVVMHELELAINKARKRSYAAELTLDWEPI